MGIEKIEIYSKKRGIPKITFDHEDRMYIRTLGTIPFYGKLEAFKGWIRTLYYGNNSALVERTTGLSVKAYLSETNFNEIRQKTAKDDVIEFYGKPRRRLGSETYDFREFNVESISF